MNRFAIHPIEYPKLWQLYKQSLASFWTVEEVDLVKDVDDWKNKLTKDERAFLEHIFTFFAVGDGVVIENLLTNFFEQVAHIPEARCFYAVQAAIETIHAEMYSLILYTFIEDLEKRESMFCGTMVETKTLWASQWKTFPEQLVAFACVEGIFFSGSFAALFWLKERGLMPGLTFSNELISRDEGLHCRFACALYHQLFPDSNVNVHAIVSSAVDIECEFFSQALKVDLIGMNVKMMTQYIKFVADYLLTQLHQPKLYHVDNPFPFMECLSLDGKTNFFERRVSEYCKHTSCGEFTLDASF